MFVSPGNVIRNSIHAIECHARSDAGLFFLGEGRITARHRRRTPSTDAFSTRTFGLELHRPSPLRSYALADRAAHPSSPTSAQ